jgi:hypothetical protein
VVAQLTIFGYNGNSTPIGVFMTFKLEFTEAELNIVFNALTQRPFSEVAQLLGKLQLDIQKQAEAQKKEATND